MKNWFSIEAKGDSQAQVTLFDEIGAFGITAKDFAGELKSIGDVGSIDVSINSQGGSVAHGNTIYNLLRKHPATVNVSVDGAALSIASVIAMAGDKVSMAENAIMMIHDPMSGAYGNATEMRKLADVLDKHKEGIVSSYMKKTGMSAEEIGDIMSEETWFTAKEAVAAGFADEVTDAVEITNSYTDPVVVLGEAPEPRSSVSKVKNKMPKGKVKQEVVMTEKVEKKKEVDVKAVEAAARAEALKGEAARCDDIRAVFSRHEGYGELLAECLKDQKVTPGDASKRLLDAIGAESKPAAAVGIDGGDVKDKFQEGATQALLIRAGMEKDTGTNEFRSLSLGDLAAKALEVNNVSTSRMRKMDIVGAAFTHSTSDFPSLLENTIGKRLQTAYGAAAETWRQWCAVGEVADFKVNSRIRLGSFNSLATVNENGEFTHGSFGEEKETIQASTKGRLISLSRQMIINDDLNGFMRIASMMGRAAARTVGNDAYGVLTTNGNMGDGIALFHASHNNLAGAGGAPTVATVGAARSAMRLQKDPDNNDTLDIRPEFILGPVALEDTLAVLMASETDPAQSNSKKPNAVRNAATVVTDPRLDTDSTTAWYLVAGVNEAPAVEVAFLDGVDTPYLESRDGFTVDGVEWKVRLDYGVAAADWRGAYKNAGV